MPTEIIGRYEVEHIIGRGAMAVVYKAIDPTIGRSVALKTMRFDVHGLEKNEVLSRFRNEARAAGKLLHPNLVTIYDAGEQEGTFYIAMECVEGSTLQALLSEQRFLNLDRTVDILSQICSGLDYAHANGVVHRDIKPANIMITRSGVVKIMDFGIAKSGAQLTTGGDVLGTPNYISPEMVKGDPIDGRSDLFSVAVVLHEMLLGERPFTAPNISTIIYKIVNEPPSPDLETKVHPAVSAILRKALAKHPSDRYQTGADLVGALKSYQALLTQPIPQTVVPGTPVLTNWPVAPSAARATAAAVAPQRLEPNPAPMPLAASSALQAPEVFGSDVPLEFRTISAPVPPDEKPAGIAPPPSIDIKFPPPPANPVASTFGPFSIPMPASVPPSAYGGRSSDRAFASPIGPKMLRIAVVAAITSVGAVLCIGAYNAISHRPKRAAVSVATPSDPVPVTLSDSAKDQEEPTREEPSVEVAPDTSTTTVWGKKKKVVPQALTSLADSAPAPAVAAAVTTADLEVASTPAGANVQLDGQNLAQKTPFTAAELSPGSHTLVFTKPGYQPLSRSVDITPGTNASISVNLTGAQTAIAFESNPAGAMIFIDEEPTGLVTPATIKLAPGAHAISIDRQGFEEGTGNLQLNAGETQHFSVALQLDDKTTRIRRVFAGAKDKGMVVIRSRPRGATIRLEDISVDAATPARIIVRNGKVNLTVEKDGYKPYHRDLQVDKGDIIVVDAILEPN